MRSGDRYGGDILSVVDQTFAAVGKQVGGFANRVAYIALEQMTENKREVVSDLPSFFLVCIGEVCQMSLDDGEMEKLATPEDIVQMAVDRVMEHPKTKTRSMTLEERKNYNNHKATEGQESVIILPFGKGGGGKGRG
jgi:hypothetical protein